MKIAVIIPTLNAERWIAPLLSAVKPQLREGDELLVIDSASDDKTVAIARSLGVQTLVIDRQDFDHGETRNLGVRITQADVAVFLSQDALPADPDFISRLIKPLEDPSVAASYGRHVPRKDAKPLEAFARGFNYPETPLVKSKASLAAMGIKAFFCTNVCCAVRLSAFEEVGGFPKHSIMIEDMVLAAKLILAGHKVAYEPTARVMHSHDFTLAQTFRRYFDIGVALNRQDWILRMTRTEPEGWRYTGAAIRHLASSGKKRWIPYAFAEMAVKYTGYRLGLSESRLPVSWKKHMSLQKMFWARENGSGPAPKAYLNGQMNGHSTNGNGHASHAIHPVSVVQPAAAK